MDSELVSVEGGGMETETPGYGRQGATTWTRLLLS